MDQSNAGAQDATRRAIELLMLWLEDDREDAVNRIVAMLEEPQQPGGHQPGMVEITGLLNLGRFLGQRAAIAEGARQEEVRDRIRRILQEISTSLP
ncbi:hypothetical protein [Nocardiopsis sp. NPDC055824]